ncbi:MAG: DUF1404 family protein [Nitrososphaerales archaeon]
MDQIGKEIGGISQRLVNSFQSVQVLGIVLFVFATSFPPFEVFTEISLPAHMLQHIIMVLAGIMITYPAYKKGKFERLRNARNAFLGFATLTAIIMVWHVPIFWDAAVVSFWTHIAEHACFLAVGAMIGIFVPMLNDNMKVMAALMAISAHMFYGFVLYISTTRVYPLYPVSQQAELGLLLFTPSPIYLIAYLYFNLTRESRRLESESSTHFKLKKGERTQRIANEKLFILAIVIVMIATMGIYYSFTFEAIGAASYGVSPHTTLIFIQEGPVSWQYSPRDITVIIGTNNTVTWVSHSFTQDTVTSANDTFSSGPISPGQTFSFTFTTPGTYRYFCQYHLWMSGTIIVLAGS